MFLYGKMLPSTSNHNPPSPSFSLSAPQPAYRLPCRLPPAPYNTPASPLPINPKNFPSNQDHNLPRNNAQLSQPSLDHPLHKISRATNRICPTSRPTCPGQKATSMGGDATLAEYTPPDIAIETIQTNFPASDGRTIVPYPFTSPGPMTLPCSSTTTQKQTNTTKSLILTTAMLVYWQANSTRLRLMFGRWMASSRQQ